MLEAAVIEWRDARQAILEGREKIPHVPPKDWPSMWHRYTDATNALFEIAKTRRAHADD